jgi:hypothetical protein
MWKNNDGTGIHSLVAKIELQGVKSKLEGEKLWDPDEELKDEWFGKDRNKEKAKEAEKKEEKAEDEAKEEAKEEKAEKKEEKAEVAVAATAISVAEAVLL